MQSVATGGRSDTCSTTHAVHTNMLTLLKMLVSIHSFQSPVTPHQLKILLIFMAYRLCSEQPTTHRTGYCVHYCRSPQMRVPYFIHYLHCMKLFKMEVSNCAFISIMCIVFSPVSGQLFSLGTRLSTMSYSPLEIIGGNVQGCWDSISDGGLAVLFQKTNHKAF